MSADQNVEKRYREESDHWLDFLRDPERKRLAESWLRSDTVDAWRHERMYNSLDPILYSYPDSDWLTVGDGRFGNDAHYILEKGHEVLATNISDTLLNLAAQKGRIRAFGVENAEKLSFQDESFDFVLCKESYHHFPRPMIALYEMLRVARKGVVLVEPNENPSLESTSFIFKRLVKLVLLRCGFSSRLRTRDTNIISSYVNAWEDVGNYVFSISEREIEKVALGMGYASCAFKGLNDYYEKGVEFEKATDDSMLFKKVKERIAKADKLCRKGLNGQPYGLLVAVIFKQAVEPPAVQALLESGFDFRKLAKNS